MFDKTLDMKGVSYILMKRYLRCSQLCKLKWYKRPPNLTELTVTSICSYIPDRMF